MGLGWLRRCSEGDSARPIRRGHAVSPKAIRGQLRCWWRLGVRSAVYGPPERSAVELIDLRETEIFGSAELPSPFDLIVSGIRFDGEHRLDEQGGTYFEGSGRQFARSLGEAERCRGHREGRGNVHPRKCVWPTARAWSSSVAVGGTKTPRGAEGSPSRERSRYPWSAWTRRRPRAIYEVAVGRSSSSAGLASVH